MPVSVRGCLDRSCSFVVVWASSSVGSCLRLWSVMGGCRMVMVAEVVGGHCRWASCRGCHWWHGWVVMLVAVVDG